MLTRHASPGKRLEAAVDVVAKRVLIALRDSATNAECCALNVWSIFVTKSNCFSSSGATKVKPAVFRPSPTVKLFGSGVRPMIAWVVRIEAEALRIVGGDVIGADVHARQDIAGRVDRRRRWTPAG